MGPDKILLYGARGRTFCSCLPVMTKDMEDRIRRLTVEDRKASWWKILSIDPKTGDILAEEMKG